jgi:hypothetical protein
VPIILDEHTMKIPLSKGKSTFIDSEDFLKIANFSWYCDPTGYARNRDGILMHRVIMDCPKDKEVDHKDHDCLNNRKHNLRICNRTQNQWNKKLSSRNTSGFKGASYNKSNGLYSADIRWNNKSRHLGYFSTPEQAHQQYVDKGKDLFGEFFCDGKSYSNNITKELYCGPSVISA